MRPLPIWLLVTLSLAPASASAQPRIVVDDSEGARLSGFPAISADGRDVALEAFLIPTRGDWAPERAELVIVRLGSGRVLHRAALESARGPIVAAIRGAERRLRAGGFRSLSRSDAPAPRASRLLLADPRAARCLRAAQAEAGVIGGAPEQRAVFSDEASGLTLVRDTFMAINGCTLPRTTSATRVFRLAVAARAPAQDP